MKKFILNLLVAILMFPMFSTQINAVEYTLNFNTLTEIKALFNQYGYYAEQNDIDWWSQNKENSFGDLEYNLARRKKLDATPTTLQSQYLGASIPQVVALFESSLQAKITSSATSFNLVDGTDKAGNALSGNYGFIINEGASNEEFVSCQCTGTACTACLRGVSPVTGNTEVASLKQEHRRGESVKLTDFPVLGVMRRVLNGDEGLPNTLYYDTAPSGSASTTAIMSKSYIDATVNQGAATSTDSVAGISEEATQLEMASSTPFDIDNPHYISSEYASSTPTVRGLGYVPVTENDGYLSQNWLDLTENFNWTGGTHTFSTTTIATSTITDLTVTGDTAGILKFGGTGADGALVTTATTTINLANANYVIKNYTSIDIELGEGLAFSNPATDGTIINLKSTGNCNIAGMIDASGMGAAGGAGGASSIAAGQGIQGTIGTTAIRIIDGSAHYGNKGGTTGSSVVGGTGGAIYTVTGLYSTTAPSIASKSIIISPGSGGGGGQGARNAGGTADLEATDGGAGGNGGGALIIECGGALTFSGVISVNGSNGVTSLATTAGTQIATTGGGGGGGAAGMAIVLYDSLTANTGTITSAGGAGGGAGGATSSGGGSSGYSGAGGGGGGAIGGAGGAGSDGIGTERNALAGNAAGGISAGGGGAGGAWSNGVAKSSAAGGAGGATNSGVVVLNTEF